MDAWQYYTSSYIRIEPTEGVDRSRMTRSVLKRNIPRLADIEAEENGGLPKALHFEENLTLRICVNTSKIIYEKGGSEYFVYGKRPREEDDEDIEAEKVNAKNRREQRAQKFKEKYELNSPWMKDLDHDQVSQSRQVFNDLVRKEPAPAASSASSADAVMT